MTIPEHTTKFNLYDTVWVVADSTTCGSVTKVIYTVEQDIKSQEPWICESYEIAGLSKPVRADQVFATKEELLAHLSEYLDSARKQAQYVILKPA